MYFFRKTTVLQGSLRIFSRSKLIIFIKIIKTGDDLFK